MTEAAGSKRPALRRTVSQLTTVNLVVLFAGLVTGPLQARALGAEGRGELAAIMTPVSLLPLVASVGLAAFAMRAAARGEDVGRLIGTTALLSAGIGLVAFVACVPIAAYLAEDRTTVHTLMLIGFALAPVGLVGGVISSVCAGREVWGPLVRSRLIPPLLGTVAIVVLAVWNELTVTSAAIAAMASGVLSLVPLLSTVPRRSLRYDRALARRSLSFGSRAWFGAIGQLANLRLDQVLMIKLTSLRELGLYAVAVTVASASAPLTSALAYAISPRIAAGDQELAARASRTVMAFVLGLSLLAGAALPIVLPLLFGDGFRDAVPIAWVLLAAGIFLTGLTVLGPALLSAGRPGVPSIAEAVAVGVTVPGLFLLVPSMGGMGAAVVSLAAYGTSFAYQVWVARRQFGLPVWAFLIPDRADLRLMWAIVASWLAGLRRVTTARDDGPDR